ncbi:MAG: CvpA family protein [Candidatus Zixiibacteriota bacterium]|nr:MAG: CvpA family protein [candidate division Zixibacteria bacterium]
MHYLDIVILIIILISGVSGGLNGFVFEALALGGLALGIYLGLRYFSWLAYHLNFLGLPDWLLNIIAFLLILIVITIAFRLVGRLLKGTVAKAFLGWLDHAVGAIFGLVRGVAVVLLLIMLLLLTPLRQVLTEEAPRTTLLKPALQLVSPYLNLLLYEHPRSPESV